MTSLYESAIHAPDKEERKEALDKLVAELTQKQIEADAQIAEQACEFILPADDLAITIAKAIRNQGD